MKTFEEWLKDEWVEISVLVGREKIAKAGWDAALEAVLEDIEKIKEERQNE